MTAQARMFVPLAYLVPAYPPLDSEFSLFLLCRASVPRCRKMKDDLAKCRIARGFVLHAIIIIIIIV